jgi:DNA-binding transcriptional LysR family regulator
MDFRFQVFKTVADKLNFTKASEHLYISQPAVSKHIRLLEQHYHTTLFERQGNKIKLTTEGKVLLSHTNQLLEHYRAIDNYFLILNQEISKNIALGASTTIAQYILPPLLVKLREAYPETKLSLVNANSTEIEEMINRQEVDFGLIEGTQNNPLLEYEYFTEDEIVLVCKNGLHSVRNDELSLKDLNNIPLIFRESGSGTRKIIQKKLKKVNLSEKDLTIEAVLGSTESIKNYVLNSNSYAFLSIHSIQAELREQKMQIIDVKGLEINRRFYFVKKKGQNSTTYETLKNFILQNQ